MPSRNAPTLGEGIRRKVRREARAIGRALASQRDVHASVHEARKAIRRLRALLALVEPRLEGAQAADRALSGLGDGLSTLRDAHVVVATAQAIAGRDGAEAWTPAIARLLERRNALMRQALARDPDFQRRRALVHRLAGDLDRLPWQDLKPGDIRHPLKRSVRRVAKAAKRAKAHPDSAHLHRWRRRVRRLRMQLEGLARVAPDLVKETASSPGGHGAKALHKLGDRLGAVRDEQMLRNVLRRMRDLPGRADLTRQLCQGEASKPASHHPRARHAPAAAPPASHGAA